MITVSEETSVDYALTARLATAAFDSDGVTFSAERIRWLYETSFGEATIVVSAFDDGSKIGQIALVGQKLRVNGEVCAAVQLADLFVTREYRSGQLVRRLYGEAEAICKARGIRYVLALPNDKAVRINERALGLSPLLWMGIRGGLSLRRPTPARLRHSGRFAAMTPDHAHGLFDDFSSPPPENGPCWDAGTLISRLSDPTRDYAVHATDNLLLISCTRRSAGIGYTALCAFFARAAAGRDEVAQLVRAACSLWKKPIFVYAGKNNRMPALPGLPVPARLRKPILVQLRDFRSDPNAVQLDRFQLIDSDFA